MPEPDFSDHPTIQAIDAAIDALTYLREGGTKMMPVSPEVWQQFIAPPAAQPKQPTPPPATTMPEIPEPSRAVRATQHPVTTTPEAQHLAHDELTAEIRQCQNCAYASETRYIGYGNTYHPRVLVVNGACLEGDTPTALGSRLEGEAGTLLRKMFAAIGLTENDLYITSPLKCPVPGRPDAKCLQNCLALLHKEILLVNPDVIVMLGDVAAKAVISRGSAAAGKVGIWHLFADKIPAIKLYHPMRLLLLNEQLAYPLKKENWEALKLLQTRLQSLASSHA
jgi:DNA polymerase